MNDVKYKKNNLLEITASKISPNNLIFHNHIQFIYSPISELFKKRFHEHLKYLSKLTDQKMEIQNLVEQKCRSYIQKRKYSRLTLSKDTDIVVLVEGVKVESVIDISLGGVNFSTKDMLRYGKNLVITISFRNVECTLQGEIRFIQPVDSGEKKDINGR